MFYSMSRFLSPHYSYIRQCSRFLNQAAVVVTGKNRMDQMDYIKSLLENNNNIEWSAVKTDILSKRGNFNKKNVDAVLLKIMTTSKKIEAALSFADHLRSSNEDLSLGSINGLLGLYYEIGKTKKLPDSERLFILDSYKSLYNTYKVLDFSTCERLLHALCVIEEWEKGLKVLDDVHLSSVPSHSTYSTLIATLFRNNKKKKAFELIERSIQNRRPLLDVVYEEWTNYILRKYKDKKTIIKHLDEICSHISRNFAIVSVETAVHIKETYVSLGWDANFTKIRKPNGQCTCCKDTLDCLKLSEKEFNLLQQNVKDKLIVGSDLFLKTSPGELDKFLSFVNQSAPYDIVLDALNIVYASRNVYNYVNGLTLLHSVIDYFKKRDKKILLIGRKHMLGWQKKSIELLMAKTCSFFTEDLSQDDPYFITAALLSGSHTDIVSKDLLRGHMFMLKNEQLMRLFRRWQWQHQWMVFVNPRGLNVQPPLKFTPCAQKKNEGWHLPYEADTQVLRQVNDGTPDLSNWLCLRPKLDVMPINQL